MCSRWERSPRCSGRPGRSPSRTENGPVLNRLRASFAAKLLLGGLILALVIIGGVSAYLLISRDSQTRAGALSNADNRAAVMREVLLRFTGAQSFSSARGMATQAPL